ncbi:MAG: M28 family metallopeptidase [Dehalococcoidales bacterium]|nr:M28 family metallopeptidase [Dehalococcoidales bacterium]
MSKHSRQTAYLALLLAFVLLVTSCMLPGPAATPSAVPPTATAETTAVAALATASPVPATSSPTLVPTATATPTLTTTPSPTQSPTAVTSGTEVSGQAAYRHVQALAAEIGSRPVGSEASKTAADYIAGQLSSYGYEVERQPFPFTQFVDHGATMAVVQPRQATLHPQTMRLSASGEVTADLVEAGVGRVEDFLDEPVGGKVVLVSRGEVEFAQMAANAEAAGAAGLVISNNVSGSFRGDLGSSAKIPIVSISLEEGRSLRDSLGQGAVAVKLTVNATSLSGQSENVIGTLKGSQPGTVIVGAHYDSVEAGPGANDNASGVGAMLELARVIAEKGTGRTVKVIAFGAEEIGLVGSRYYVSMLDGDQLRDITAMVNLDMVGVGDQLRLSGSPRLVELATGIARDLGSPPQPRTGQLALSSDHSSFLSISSVPVPALFVTRTEDPNYHTAQDETSFVSADSLAIAAELTLGILEQLAGAG